MIIGTDANNRNVKLDLPRLIETRMLVQANSGAGKSWTLRRILEQTHGKTQQIVIDVEDEFYTLREKYDYVLAGRHGGDCPADVRSASLLARRLLELGVSAIVGIYELKQRERIQFVRLFLESLISAPRDLWHPCLIVLDEAHMFAPEKGEGEAESTEAVVDLMSKGRKRAFAGVLATQRISKLQKSAAAEANNKLIGRSALDTDMRRAARELGFSSREDELSLRNLADGEFYAFGPAISPVVTRCKVGPVETTHPKAGQRAAPPPPPKDKVQKVLAQLADLPQEAEREQASRNELQRQVRDLKAKLAQLEKLGEQQGAKQEGKAGKEDPERLKREFERGAKSVKVALAKELKIYERAVDKLISNTRVTIGAIYQDAKQEIERMDATKKPAMSSIEGIIEDVLTAPQPPLPIRRTPAPAPSPMRPAPPRGDGSSTFSGSEQKILDAIAELESLGIERPAKVQVGFMAGYTNLASKGFKNAAGALRTAGMIDYPTSDSMVLTEAGRNEARMPDAPRTTEELQQRIMDMLGGAHAKILRELIAIAPDAIEREKLGELTGYTNVASKGFKNALGRMRTLGLIDYPDRASVAATGALFLVPAGRRAAKA